MDSIYGACLDTRRSVPGAVVVLAKGAVSWLSRVQAVSQVSRRRRTLPYLRRGKGGSMSEKDPGFHETVP